MNKDHLNSFINPPCFAFVFFSIGERQVTHENVNTQMSEFSKLP